MHVAFKIDVASNNLFASNFPTKEFATLALQYDLFWT